MNFARLMLRSAIIGALFFGLGYPAAYMAIHGLDPRVWPNLANTPASWIDVWRSALIAPANTATVVGMTYIYMAMNKASGLAVDGQAALISLVATSAMACYVLFKQGSYVPLRHYSRRYGDARFAGRSDLRRMRAGLELGIDPETGKAVRIQVQGNLVTIAPPRTGKTGGVILPNLLFAEPDAWAGPVVVIDPKGDVVRAVKRRREHIGQRVRVIDPLSIAGGTDRWDPLANLRPDDVLELQGAARAMLPDIATPTEAASFFRERAIVIVAAALQIAVRNQDSILSAAALVRNWSQMLAELQDHDNPLADDARGILSMSDKTRGDILGTAAQAFGWLLDPRMQAAVENATMTLDEMCDGTSDLYIVLPADNRKAEMAPYVRWLLDDLFSVVRRRRVAERILVVVDEAAVLGRYDSIIQGSGELPGYGVSLWTFWQSESQISQVFGTDKKDVLIGTAEALMLFNLSAAQGPERQRWSDTLGTFTAVHETVSIDPNTGRENKSTSAGPEALVPASDLARLTHEYTLVFLNSRAYTTDPLKLKKALAHEDPRFKEIGDFVQPVG